MGEGWDVLKAVGALAVSGFRFVSRDEYRRRLDICADCDSRGDERVKYDVRRCGECGCFVAVKATAGVWKCPIGKWNENTIQ